jgi:hypothetical protein
MTAIKEIIMNIQSHRQSHRQSRWLGRAAAILAAGAFLAACSSKPRERSAESGGNTEYYSASAAGTDSIYPFGPGYQGNAGMGGTGTILLDTIYQRDKSGIRSDSLNPGSGGIPGTGLPGSQGRGGSGMDTLRGPDSMNRDSSLILPDIYPGTGAPGSRPEGGSGQGGTRDSMNLDRINDSLGVLDWYERG